MRDVAVRVQTLSPTIPNVHVFGCDDEVPANLVKVDPEILPATVVVHLLQLRDVTVEQGSRPVLGSSLCSAVVTHPGSISGGDEGFLDLVNHIRVQLGYGSDYEEGGGTALVNEELGGKGVSTHHGER